MARLILKSPYIKSTGGASGYLRYIATRERVELIPDDRPPTRKQEQLITKLVKDFPDSKTLYEYQDYLATPTKVNASAFITLVLEANWDSIHESEQYMKYIATRPRAERVGAHGLFGDEDAVALDKAMEELENYTGNVWTHIISLKREDAARLGFDNAVAWRNLIRAHRNDIAAAMKIPPGDFRWYAAFHDEGEHPHIHMMAWSAKPGQVYLSKEGIRQIKSKLTNDIFRNEMLHLYEQKSESRDELVREAQRAMLELVQTMRDSMCDHPDAERLMLELAAQLETVKGKKSYGYLPKRLKKLVDEIVDEMERLPGVSRCYDQWLLLQGKVDAYYHDKPQERVPLSKQKEFTQIKNAVIREAECLRLDKITFEEKNLGQYDEPEEFHNESYDYGTLRDVIRDESLTMEERGKAVSEMEKLAEGGNRYAQYLMGKLWRDGPLLIPDSVEARYWFERAADQGHLVAQYSLAKLYLSNDLEVRDTRTGMNWLYTVPGNMTYKQWAAKQEAIYGEGIIEKSRQLSYNANADKKQWKAYKERLGNEAPRSFSEFQELKYDDTAEYDELVNYYRYKGKNPNSSKGFFEAEQVRQQLISAGIIRAKGTVVTPPFDFTISNGNTHAVQRLAERDVTLKDAQAFVDNAVFALKQQNGAVYAFYSENGFAVVDTDGLLRTAGHLDEKGQKLFDEAVKQIEKHK